MAKASEAQKQWLETLSAMGGSDGGLAKLLAEPPTDAGAARDPQPAVGSLEQLLDQKPTSPNPLLDGMDTGKLQALPALGPLVGPATAIGKAGWNWISKQGTTTIIIENHSSKDLTFADDQKLIHLDQAKWVKKAPSTIAAGGKDKIIVKTDMMIRGVKRGDTSGYAVYQVFGKDKTTAVRIAWFRKGDGGLDSRETWAAGPYEIEGSQTNEGEFTFLFTDLVPATPPKDPQTDGSKDSKSAPPADTYVLFGLNESKLDSKAESALHKFAIAYLAAQSTAKIYVSGYASIEGPEARNETLSFDRAKKVFEFLSTDGKLPGGNIQWEGLKTTVQFDPKQLPPNRRVTFSLTPPKGSAATAPATEPKEPQSPADPKAKAPQSRDNEEIP